jgi:hypothetical protein
MTTIWTLPTYEIVHRVHPRPVTEQDEVGLVVGKAIDETLSRFSHEAREGRRPSLAAMARLAGSYLEEGLRDADLRLEGSERERLRFQVEGVLAAFRKSPVLGCARPRTRLILIDGEVGVYAQPDYWDPRGRFYEMKSYRAVPPPPDVALQMEFFQLAFPGFEPFLLCIDRHSTPVSTTLTRVAALTPGRREELLALAYRLGKEAGETKVLEYVDNPIVRHSRGG